jgi:DNA helicase-2/ATP-dependent DNA helicase PcrA
LDLDHLNPPQRAAVTHERGPLLVLAGAGSGKTRVITHRIAALVEGGMPPYNMLALTFTNKAAQEMRERAEALLGGTNMRGMLIGTFHATCARLLRQYGEVVGLSPRFVIYDTDDQRTLVKRIIKEIGVPERIFSPRDVLGHIDRAKNEGKSADDYKGHEFFTDVVAKIYPLYERALLAADATDFGNLLLKTLELLQQHEALAEELSARFYHVLVDEFQDTNRVQYEIVRLLSQYHGNLCVVGDDDQSIYGWRGADIRNILDFEKDHPTAKVVKLEQNYRSTQVILDAAHAVISRNSGRKPKKLWTDAGAGESITQMTCTDERDEAIQVVRKIQKLRQDEGLKLEDFAIFYRTHAHSRAIEEALRQARLQHVVVGGIRFFDRAEIKDALAYLQLAVNPKDEISFRRIVNTPPRGIGNTTVEKIAVYARKNDIPLLEAANRCATSQEAASVLGAAPKKKVGAFCRLIDELAALSSSQTPAAVAEVALEKSGYLERLAADDSIESQTRTENLGELLSSLRDYELHSEEPTLLGFLEQVALSSEADDVDEEQGAITLMTVHSAKGLEFPVVFVVALEQGVFPHSRSLDDIDQMEEERRLAYVALTRAKRHLYVSHAVQRLVFGQRQQNEPSAFLSEIPKRLVVHQSSVRLFQAPQAQGIGYGGTYGAQLGGRGDRRRIVDGGARRNAARANRPAWQQREQQSPAGADNEVWVDYSFDQGADAADGFDSYIDEPTSGGGYRIGMRVRHRKFGVGVVRATTGSPPNQNLTIAFKSVGPKTVRAQFVQRE